MSFKYLDPTGVGYFWYKIKSLVSTKYTKPDTGIPKSDLESSVQTTLTNADTVITNFSNKIDKVNGATAGNIAILNATGSITDGNTSIQNVELNVDTNGHTYVDLGLPSGTLWATCNVGATNPEDYGDYYAWGETQTKQEYSWNTYQHGSSNSNITKYNVTDGKTELEPYDDVCHIVMGGDWRMPTEVQCRELIANTTYTWTTTNGVTGILLTSTVNNNTLFIPAGGYINNTSITDLTIQSCIWSSNLYIHETYGIMGVSELSYRETGSLIVINNDRYKGYPCRGIINKSGIQFKQGKTVMPVKTTASAVEFPDGETVLSKVSDLEENKVDKVSGKSLSTNDYTTEDKTKLSNIASGAQVNVLETVKVNDNPLTITNKSVNIDLSNYAQKDGSYSGMTVGAAEDLVSAESVASEFTSRITGGSTAVGKGGTALVDKIKGRTLVLNQLIKNAYIHFTYDNSAGTSTASGDMFSAAAGGFDVVNGHKYAIIWRDTNSSVRLRNVAANFQSNYLTSSIWTAPATTTDGLTYVRYAVSAGAIVDTYINVTDLTLMFGAGNEPSTFAEFEALYPLPYYDYHPGKLINNGLQSEYDLVWNQLLANGNFANGTTGWSQYNSTISASNGELTIVKSSGTVSTGAFARTSITGDTTHKYYMACEAEVLTSGVELYLGFHTTGGTVGGNAMANAISSSYQRISQVASPVSSTDTLSIRVGAAAAAGGSTGKAKNVMLVDLTLMFGAGNEPSTPGEFEAMFPADYYPYDTGTEQHFSFPQFKTKIETVGWNIWDEELEKYSYNQTTGEKQESGSAIRSKNKFFVIPGTSLYLYLWDSIAGIRFFKYAADGSYLGTETSYGKQTYTIPSGVYLIAFQVSGSLYQLPYKNDICISLSDPSRNGTYEPHWRSELELGLGDIKVKSHNLWDEETETGTINHTTGAKETSAYAQIRSKNYIPCSPNATYYIKSPSDDGGYVYVHFYDSEHNFISGSEKRNTTAIAPANASYFLLSFNTNYGNTYTNDVCINLSDPAFNGRYEPHGDGGVISITGGLKSAGTVYDEISGGKLVKRIWEEKSLDRLSWTLTGDGRGFYTTGISSLISSNAMVRYICPRYASVFNSSDSDQIAAADKTISAKTSGNVFIKDSAYSDAPSFIISLAGVPLYYELAQPIEYELAEAIPTAMRNDPYGTERRLPEETSAIVTAPFRADITYSTNIKEAVQSLPQNYINVNSMQDFLAALGAQMGGTWTMRPADGKFDFTFTKNEQPVL